MLRRRWCDSNQRFQWARTKDAAAAGALRCVVGKLKNNPFFFLTRDDILKNTRKLI
jgi:hypothetical protein